MTSFFLRQKAWLWPLLALAIITPFTPQLDLAITNYFYQPTQSFPSNPFYNFLYNYGLIPAQLLFSFSATILFLSWFLKKWKSWHTPALILTLSLLIGSGLIVHEIFKEHWGRPRPKQVIEFGGSQPFRPYYEPNFFHQPEPSKGFSCGHCTMGFYFFTLALVARRLNYMKTFWTALILAFALGITLSLARIAQGGHFFSDTLISAIVMWLTAYTCVHWLYPQEKIS
ncbi:MAG TPA: phosphatase PAP2 family protein [Parachlamydiaceae bacterium]|nr:phosphatase PAP2 family protein [Parachlamydiaceae bacterium]